jgi:serine/threonine protein kinase
MFVFVVLEVPRGGDFPTFLENHSFVLEEVRGFKIIEELAEGIKYLHSFGIVIRDFNLSSVLMVNHRKDSSLKISDLGMAQVLLKPQKCPHLPGN